MNVFLLDPSERLLSAFIMGLDVKYHRALRSPRLEQGGIRLY